MARLSHRVRKALGLKDKNFSFDEVMALIDRVEEVELDPAEDEDDTNEDGDD